LCLAGNDDNVKFLGVAKNFWPLLDNTLTLCELSGIYAIANPRGQDHLDLPLFKNFCNTVSKMKYPGEIHHLEKLIDELISARAMKCAFDNPTFTKSMEKSVMRVLLKFDMPLRRSFSAFAGRGVKIGGGLTWEEVKRMEVGMDLEGFTAFCGAYALIPNSLSLQQCTTLGRDILMKYPLLKSKTTLSSTLLYPQFQLLLCFAAVAVEQAAAASPTPSKTNSPGNTNNMSRQRQTINRAFSFNRAGSRHFSKEEAKPIYSSLSDLLKHVGIDVPDSMAALARTAHVHHEESVTGGGSTVRFEDTTSTVILPSSDKPEDMYSKASNHTRESTFLRMENLFDEVTLKIRNLRYSDDLTEGEKMDLPGDLEEYSTASLRNTGKPTVIGDSIPPPMSIPASVQHSLEAALAYHNLGSYEESLKYLETARAQLTQAEREKQVDKKKTDWRKTRGASDKNLMADENDATTLEQKLEVNDSDIVVPAEPKLYIIACKGNVYQSCGDDEQSMLQYMLGWNEASALGEKDWEAIFINSIGLLSFYNLRYELAWKCFSLVTSFRSREYGIRSADTATSWNNTACCLLCMSRTSEARVLFEQARTVFVDALGDRHPRTLVSGKNCVKARRSQTIVHTQNMKANIAMRPDADRLLLGKDISINAAPLEVKPKTSVASSGGGKSKGKKKKK